MPSFDIVSEVNLSEADNAVQNVMREIGTRYDFKGSKSKVEVPAAVSPNRVVAPVEKSMASASEVLPQDP